MIREDEGSEASRTDRFQALCALAQEMALVEREHEIYRVVLEVARKVLDFTNCGVLLIDEETDELVMVAERGYPPETRGIRLPLGTGRGISTWVAEHGQRVYVPDVREDDRYVPGVPGARTELAVPIEIQDRTIGVLNVESDEIDAFDRDEAMLLQALASQMAVALELNRTRAELDRLSITDPLTGVYNRRYLQRLLPSEKERSERFEHPFGILLFDIDDFKQINDRYGHSRGDRVLQAFADALRDTVRKIDPVIRYGGDEFLVLLLETGEEGAEAACERIRRAALERFRSSDSVEEEWDLEVSVGLSVREPGEDIDRKLREADRSMYEDKEERASQR
ncbi:MAG: sensor domain-containing diguanylate cyclase [Gemmatimonadota bacterium]|nr:sensor domain-containing diguanylate cyclase [Gemmatimonadota bacterium]